MSADLDSLQTTNYKLPTGRGLLISFDGLDSSGKATQAKKLADRLREKGWMVHEFTTPDYSTPSGQELKARLQNRIGDWRKISWPEKLKYFATNRAEHRNEVITAIQREEIVIYDRYVPSSLAFIAAEALAAGAQDVSRDQVYQAVQAEEYDKNKMPHEDISIFLNVPPKISTQLLESRKHKLSDQDEYTDHVAVQRVLYQEYVHLAASDRQRFLVIDCAPGGNLSSVEEISERVWQGLIKRYKNLV